MNKQTRTYEEIISLQDRAIEALTQANAALVMALEALKKARAEHGFAVPLPGLGAGKGNIGEFIYSQPYVHPQYVSHTPDGQWYTGRMTGFTTGLTEKSVAATSLLNAAQSQRQLALDYVNAFQVGKAAQIQAVKEYDEQVGSCI